MGGTRFFPVPLLGYFMNTPKIQFKYANLEDPMTRFQEIGQNVLFWAKKGIFEPKLAQNGPNGVFWAKSENVTSVALGSSNFVPNFRKFL